MPLWRPGEPSTDSGYELDLYEREYEKYGGVVGMETAEEVFESSSRLAAAIVKGLFLFQPFAAVSARDPYYYNDI